MSICLISGVSRISFRGGSIFFWKSVGEAARLLGGFGGMLPRENFKKWCNLVRFREYFAKILSKNGHFFYIKITDMKIEINRPENISPPPRNLSNPLNKLNTTE